MSESSENIVKMVCIIFGFIVGAIIGSQYASQRFLAHGESLPWQWLWVGFWGMFGGWMLSGFIRDKAN